MTETIETNRPALTMGGAPGEETLDAAQLAFGGARVGLAGAVARLMAQLDRMEKDGDLTDGVREVNVQLAAATKALSTCTEQEAKAREKWLHDTGGGGLDLDAARDEVGRRLARLAAQVGS